MQSHQTEFCLFPGIIMKLITKRAAEIHQDHGSLFEVVTVSPVEAVFQDEF